jgi:hypothetical protein
MWERRQQRRLGWLQKEIVPHKLLVILRPKTQKKKRYSLVMAAGVETREVSEEFTSDGGKCEGGGCCLTSSVHASALDFTLA